MSFKNTKFKLNLEMYKNKYIMYIIIGICLIDRYQWAGSVSFMYVDVFPPTATVYTVTGLNPSTTYNFSVNAINTMGESSYADNNKILTVTTAGIFSSACLIKLTTHKLNYSSFGFRPRWFFL